MLGRQGWARGSCDAKPLWQGPAKWAGLAQILQRLLHLFSSVLHGKLVVGPRLSGGFWRFGGRTCKRVVPSLSAWGCTCSGHTVYLVYMRLFCLSLSCVNS